jgi:hypothetical protein
VTGVRLEPLARHQCRLHVKLPRRGGGAEHYMAIRQLYEGTCVGQLTWNIVEGDIG